MGVKTVVGGNASGQTADEVRKAAITKLRALDGEADALRRELKLPLRNELVWEHFHCFDERIIVEADGYGGGTATHIQDLGGCDRIVKHDREVHYDDVDEACKQAAIWAGRYEEMYGKNEEDEEQ